MCGEDIPKLMLTRTSVPAALRYRNNSNDVTFRALYNTDKMQISNKLSLAFYPAKRCHDILDVCR